MKEKVKMTIQMIIVIILIILIGWLVCNRVIAQTSKVVNPVATFEVQDYGTVKMELYPEYAPNTVANFIALINSGFYNNKVIFGKDDVCLYMARDTAEDAKGPTISLIDDSVEAGSENDYEYEINGEFVANQFPQNTLRHEKGVISLNRSDYSSYGLTEESYNSGSYRFSVMMTENANLNGVYCAFGKITEGMEILEKIYREAEIKPEETEEGKSDESGEIQEFASQPVITNAHVETYGVNYAKPEVHKAFDIQGYINELYSQYLTY